MLIVTSVERKLSPNKLQLKLLVLVIFFIKALIVFGSTFVTNLVYTICMIQIEQEYYKYLQVMTII